MIVCHCHGVTDREIIASAQNGASTCQEVADRCGAGAGCGGCESLVAEILQGERRRLAVVTSLRHEACAPGAESACPRSYATSIGLSAATP